MPELGVSPSGVGSRPGSALPLDEDVGVWFGALIPTCVRAIQRRAGSVTLTGPGSVGVHVWYCGTV